MDIKTVIKTLKQLGNPDVIAHKQNQFGIHANNCLGIYQKDIKRIAKEIGINSELGEQCFDTGIYEARILCSKIVDPQWLTKSKMKQWVKTFENWEICDSFCMGLFAKNKHAIPLAYEWTRSRQQFIKRAGFVIMACYGFNDKTAGNKLFEEFFPVMIREAHDDRIYVYKAINWALRQVAKRNPDLHKRALIVANTIVKNDQGAAKWIATDAIRQLTKSRVNILNYPRSKYGKPV